MIEMIVKYRKDDVWGYIDSVKQVAVKAIDYDELIDFYDSCECYKDVTHAGEKDTASYFGSEKLPDNIASVNKVFLMATQNQDDWGHNAHSENMLDPSLFNEGVPAYVVLMYLEDCKEYDSMVFVTNQRCFLMNDKGQTIERIV